MRSPRQCRIGQGERSEWAAIGGIPEPDGRIAVGRRGERPAIGSRTPAPSTDLIGPRRIARSDRPATSQSRIVRSSEPLARVLPSGENATHRAAAACPSSRARHDAVGRVPERDGAVAARRGDRRAVGRERDRTDQARRSP